MSFEAQRKLLSGRVAAFDFGLPVALPNNEFHIPKNAPYAEFHILSSKPHAVGGEGRGKLRQRFIGGIQLTVWVPMDKGTKAASTAGGKFAGLFQWKMLRDSEGCVYRFEGMEEITPSTKEGWSVTIYRISYSRDEVAQIDVTV